MRRRIGLMSGLLATLAMLWLTASAFAGGWAVTTIDPLPQRMQAGETYEIGFIMRQHGVTPFGDGAPLVSISLGDQQLSFPGKPDGQIGHYVAAITFPVDGEWQWSVDQRPFPQTQSLGVLTIQAASTQSSSLASVPALPPASAFGPEEMLTDAEAKPLAELALLGVFGFAAVGVGVVLLRARAKGPASLSLNRRTTARP